MDRRKLALRHCDETKRASEVLGERTLADTRSRELPLNIMLFANTEDT